MVRILVLKRLYNLSDEQIEYQLLDRTSYKRFCGLTNATHIPDRTTVWTFENRIGEAGAKALFDGVSAQLLRKGFIARGGQIIDATLVPAPKQHNSRDEKELIDQGAMPVNWKPAKRRQKDLNASWTKKHGKSHFGYKLSINVDRKYKVIRQIETDTASTNDSQHFERSSIRATRAGTSMPIEAIRLRSASVAQGKWFPEPDPEKRQAQQGAVRLPAAAQPPHRQNSCPGRACVRGNRADGWKVDPHDRPGSGQFCDDDDGGQLQPEAAGVFRESGNRGLLTPLVGPIAGVRGDLKQNRSDSARKGGDWQDQYSRIPRYSSCRARIH
jgi:IS5 family transposase